MTRSVFYPTNSVDILTWLPPVLREKTEMVHKRVTKGIDRVQIEFR
jgi:hypothetical protein